MPAIGFTEFKEKIKNGEKKQTIRKVGKRVIKPGDTLYLYWHLRRKDCELIKTAKCTAVFTVPFSSFSNDNETARADGFKDSWELRLWFQKTHKPKPEDMFYIIRWE